MIKENINDRVNRNILKCEFSHFNGIYSLTTEDIKDVNLLPRDTLLMDSDRDMFCVLKGDELYLLESTVQGSTSVVVKFDTDLYNLLESGIDIVDAFSILDL